MHTSASTLEISRAANATAGRTPWWLWCNLLSLDAPLVACLWQFLAAKDTGTALPRACRLALPLTVWVIYLADRLLDSIRADDASQTARHGFYRRHRVGGLALLISVSLMLATTIRFLPSDVIRNGLLVGGLVGIYLLIVHALPFCRTYLPKELAVALIFSSGTMVTAWTRMAKPLSILPPALLFAAVCWLNCCAIEVWESPASARPAGLNGWLVQRLTGVSAAVCCAAILLLPFSQCSLLLLAVVVCSLAYCWLDRIHSSLGKDSLRVLADLPLVLPVLLLLSAR